MLPWNWFASDSTAAVAKAEAKGDAADTTLRGQAQVMAEATKLAIEEEKARQLAAGGISRELMTAGEYADRTVSILGATEGWLGFSAQRQIAEMVRLRNSAVTEERTRGDKLLAAADRIAGNAAAMKIKAEQDLAAAHRAVAGEQRRALVAEEKYNRIWFWIIVAVGVFVLLQLLPLIAKAFPGVGPLATAAGMILSPVAQATLGTMRKQAGQLIHKVESKVEVTAATLREHFDGPLAVADQRSIAAAYDAAKNK